VSRRISGDISTKKLERLTDVLQGLAIVIARPFFTEMKYNPLMSYETPPPQQVPEPGYYYHYKHKKDGPVNNYAYYIYGVGHHTEDDCKEEDTFMMVYRPLYEAYVYKLGKMFDLRPLHMFYETAIVDGKEIPRFSKITDPEIIAQLKEIQVQMYPQE